MLAINHLFVDIINILCHEFQVDSRTLNTKDFHCSVKKQKQKNRRVRWCLMSLNKSINVDLQHMTSDLSTEIWACVSKGNLWNVSNSLTKPSEVHPCHLWGVSRTQIPTFLVFIRGGGLRCWKATWFCTHGFWIAFNGLLLCGSRREYQCTRSANLQPCVSSDL